MSQTTEIKNLIKEIDEWVTEKDDALEICILLMYKFDITIVDYIDRLNELNFINKSLNEPKN
jgi:hypothetical protein